MRFTVVVPSYWRRPAAEPWRATDSVYDHPVPLDEEGTLGRLLDSLSVLRGKDFRLVVLAVANAEDVREAVPERIANIVRAHNPAVETWLFSYDELAIVHGHLRAHGGEELVPLLELDGYSNIRNLCVFAAHLFGSEAAVLIDDDEVFEDPEFMDKAGEFIGGRHGGRDILAVAGYYVNPDGDFFLNRKPAPWMARWNKDDCMNRAFAEVIAREPRLKVTPFAFGGNLIIHRRLFTEVPFDPLVPRGEDIDFLINARMFGHPVYLDNRLSIKHLPPPKTYPTWRRVREDILRFVFEKKKLDSQVGLPGMTHVSAADLDPYPGEFLKEDIEERIVRSNEMLAEDYRGLGNPEAAEECLTNIRIARDELRAERNLFRGLIDLRRRWKKLMAHFSDPGNAAEVRRALGFSSRS